MTFRKLLTASLLVAMAALSFSCKKDLNISGRKPDTPKEEEKKEESSDIPTKPAEGSLKIVAHRGGSMECTFPDNSRASLKYAMSLKCYASECDIYWTKDNKVVVGHATSDYKLNGLKIWENTLEEIQKAGKLKNGETMPSLEDFIDIVMVQGNCTRLWLDIKITDPTDYAIKAVQRACEIIKDKHAENFCEFICTSNGTVGTAAASCEAAYKIPVGWMANTTPSSVIAKGFHWANLNAKNHMTPHGARTVDEFVKAGVDISVFNVDKKGSTDGNAVTSDSDVAYYVQNYNQMKAVCTNYPAWFKQQLVSGGVVK